MKEEVGIKKTVRDYGIDEKEFLDRLDEMAEQAFDDQCTGTNPRFPLISRSGNVPQAYYGELRLQNNHDRPTEQYETEQRRGA